MSNASLIFFRSGAATLDDAAKLLAERGYTIDGNEKSFYAQWKGGPFLCILLAQEPYVLAEAIEIGKESPYAEALSQCDCRFEITFESIDEMKNEKVTLIEAQLALMELTNGVMFNTWSGKVLGAEAPN